MYRHIVKRLGSSLLVVVLVSFITFVILHLLPGDPALAMLGTDTKVSPEVLAQLRQEMGLNDPLYVQYIHFLGNALHGDFGRSFRTRALVTEEIAKTLPATAQLTAGGLLVALLIGLPLGIAAGTWQNSWIDTLGIAIATVGVSVPIFWLGLAMISLFSFRLGWLPANGAGDWRTLVLPSLTLGFGGAAIIARMMRSSLVEVLREDYIRTARSKGLRERAVILRHALKNALIPVLTTVGLQVGGLLSGAVFIETIFSRPGIGRLLLQAVQSRDFPVAQALVFLIGSVYVVVNILVDILYAYLDPRIHYG